MYTNVQTFSFVWLLFTGAFTFSEPVPVTTHSPGTSVLRTADMAQQVRSSLNRLHSKINDAHHSYEYAQNIIGSTRLPPSQVLSLMVTGPLPVRNWTQLRPSKIFTNCISTLRTIVSPLRSIKAEESSRAQQTGNTNDKNSAKAVAELKITVQSSYRALELQATEANIPFNNTAKMFNMHKLNQLVLGSGLVSARMPMKTIRNYAILDMLQYMIQDFTQVCQVQTGS